MNWSFFSGYKLCHRRYVAKVIIIWMNLKYTSVFNPLLTENQGRGTSNTTQDWDPLDLFNSTCVRQHSMTQLNNFFLTEQGPLSYTMTLNRHLSLKHLTVVFQITQHLVCLATAPASMLWCSALATLTLPFWGQDWEPGNTCLFAGYQVLVLRARRHHPTHIGQTTKKHMLVLDDAWIYCNSIPLTPIKKSVDETMGRLMFNMCEVSGPFRYCEQ
jgi:hypothetical protein